MAVSSRETSSEKTSTASSNRWIWAGLFLCVCIFIVQLVSPSIGALCALSELTCTSTKLRDALYYSPCGNTRDRGSEAVERLSACGESARAMQLLAIAMKVKPLQHRWDTVSGMSYHLESIDRDGKLSASRWCELCLPCAEQVTKLYNGVYWAGSAQSFRVYRRQPVFNLITGYENHGLLAICEDWYQKMLSKDEEIEGARSWAYRDTLYRLGKFYERHERKVDADKIFKQIAALDENLDKDHLVYREWLKQRGYTYRD